jgi:lipopolysaccharide biosynthesis protein
MLRNRVVLDIDNHGRDIYPLAAVVNAGLLDAYDLILKVHTKRSPWREQHDELAGSGQQWRSGLFDALLGSEEEVRQIMGAFAEHPDLGAVTANGSVLGPEFWGGDLEIVRTLLRRLELVVDPDSLRFPAGSMYWIRGFLLKGLRALNLTAADFEHEAGQVDATTAHGIERSIGLLAAEAGCRVVERSDTPSSATEAWRHYEGEQPAEPRLRVMPFYLPQFHAIPENDRWWGQGFTEWTNVTAAHPVFHGHHQPKLPSTTGFYDLRLDAVRDQQSSMAAAAGVEGFMYYYYWFAGRRLLSMPIEKLLASDVDKPFCLMWANENWTRRWDGRSEDMLIGQDYDKVPAADFIDDVMPFLQDPRYLRVDGRPILAVYRIAQIPGYRDVVRQWRERAREAGVGELMLLSVDVAKAFDGLEGSAESAGLDGILGFPPHNTLWEWLPHAGYGVDPRFAGNLLSYDAVVSDAIAKLRKGIPDTAYPGVMVTFDNTARRQWISDVWYGSNPYTFRRWLAEAARAVSDREPQHRIVFINAWNEWAEGAVLEPSDRYGATYLAAVRDVIQG